MVQETSRLQNLPVPRVGMVFGVFRSLGGKLSRRQFVKERTLPCRIIEVIPFDQRDEMLRANHAQAFHQAVEALI